MRVSFTGTRLGMSGYQMTRVERWINNNRYKITLAAHGCCIGADHEFHRTLRAVLGDKVKIIGFPSTNLNTRMDRLEDLDTVAPTKAPLERNRDIVLCGNDVLLACPYTNAEIIRSGTWHTVRLARKLGIKVIVFERFEGDGI